MFLGHICLGHVIKFVFGKCSMPLQFIVLIYVLEKAENLLFRVFRNPDDVLKEGLYQL